MFLTSGGEAEGGWNAGIEAGHSDRCDGGGASVLLVDDEPSALRTNEPILTRFGFNVTSVRTVLQAVERTVSEPPVDVIVTDLDMAHGRGLELVRAVRERGLEVPVIVTGNPEIESVVRSLEYRTFRYLIKPVGVSELAGAIQRAARQNRLAEAAREAQHLARLQPAGYRDRFEAALRGSWIATQPTVSMKARRAVAFEARIRTDEPGLVRPCDLFEAAATLGRTVELGRTIRARVAAFLRETETRFPVFVHVHPEDLDDPDLFAPDGVLSRYASRIYLQITDRTEQGVSDLAQRVVRLRALGYRIAIDGLGAGYAALSVIAESAPQAIKADRSLVRSIEASPVKQKLFAALIALGRELDIAVVAEGIETVAERDTIVALGGDLLQGFLFAAPGRGLPEPAF